MGNQHSPWSVDEAEVCIKLWEEGKSGAEIGRVLNKSRSAVCGFVCRLREGGHKFQRPHMSTMLRAEQAAMRQANQLKSAKGTARATAVFKPKQTYFPKDRTPREPPPLIDVSNAKVWLERRFGECAAPIGGEGADTLSCCTPCGDDNYCKAHRAAYYLPTGTEKELVRGLRRSAA